MSLFDVQTANFAADRTNVPVVHNQVTYFHNYLGTLWRIQERNAVFCKCSVFTLTPNLLHPLQQFSPCCAQGTNNNGNDFHSLHWPQFVQFPYWSIMVSCCSYSLSVTLFWGKQYLWWCMLCLVFCAIRSCVCSCYFQQHHLELVHATFLAYRFYICRIILNVYFCQHYYYY